MSKKCSRADWTNPPWSLILEDHSTDNIREEFAPHCRKFPGLRRIVCVSPYTKLTPTMWRSASNRKYWCWRVKRSNQDSDIQ